MFGMVDRLRSAASAGGVMAGAGLLALLGVVWLSIAAVSLLSRWMPAPAAMAVVGVVAMAPLLIVLLRRRPAKSAPEAEPSLPGDAAAIVRLAQSAQALAEKAPLAGMALTLGAAFLASRSALTSPLAIHMLAEAVERWIADKPAEPSPPPPPEA